jgi:hypothetical protein
MDRQYTVHLEIGDSVIDRHTFPSYDEAVEFAETWRMLSCEAFQYVIIEQ